MIQNIAKNLKTLRNSAGYSQKEVAEFIGIKKSSYTIFESNKCQILMPFNLLQKICDLYGITISDLINYPPKNAIPYFNIKPKDKKDIKEISNFRKIILNYLKMCA